MRNAVSVAPMADRLDVSPFYLRSVTLPLRPGRCCA